jgi:hypothetical protein
MFDYVSSVLCRMCLWLEENESEVPNEDVPWWMVSFRVARTVDFLNCQNLILSNYCVRAEKNLLTGKLITEIGNLVKLASIDLGTRHKKKKEQKKGDKVFGFNWKHEKNDPVQQLGDGKGKKDNPSFGMRSSPTLPPLLYSFVHFVVDFFLEQKRKMFSQALFQPNLESWRN